MIILPLAIFIYSSEETMSLDKVKEEQLNSETEKLYGTALHNNTVNYKRHMLNSTESKIIALGSSRILQFRANMFLDSFYNAGRVMGSINAGSLVIKDIIKQNPEIVFINVDPWWFNENYQKSSASIDDVNSSFDPSDSYPIKITHIKDVAKWLFSKKLTFDDLYNTIFYRQPNIGISASKGDGYGADGAYYNTRQITGQSPPESELFDNEIQRIKNNKGNLKYGSSASDRHIDNFTSLVEKISSSGVKVVVFFPPFALKLHELFQAKEGDYKYMDDIKEKLTKRGVEYFDFSDPRVIGSDTCEFFDGTHGGEITYARILLDLANKRRDIQKYINIKYLKSIVKKYQGSTFVPNAEITTLPEIDFLEIGCQKIAHE
jgi:hypothetical protein